MIKTGWLEVCLSVNGELAEAVAELFARFAPNGVITEQGVQYNGEEDPGTPSGPVTVRAYLPVDDQLEERRRKLEESLYYLGMIQPLPKPEYKSIADQNWMESWKKQYQPILIGRRLVILPAWAESPEPERIAVKIDPGMAFGTGTHPSTQLCLEMMEKYFSPGRSRSNEVVHRRNGDASLDVQKDFAPRSNPTDISRTSGMNTTNSTSTRNDKHMRVIDVGCGSGILSIAALKMGADQALGVDIDADSIKNARENAELNLIGEELILGTGSVGEILDGIYPFKRAQLILANILAPVIVRLFKAGLEDLIEKGGSVISSGILSEQELSVVDAANEQGLRLTDRSQMGDWVALMFSRGES